MAEPTVRDVAIAAFLDAAGWTGATRRPLAGDASFRRYHRIDRDGTRAVLMDAPPGKEDVRPFVAIARHLDALGFSAPRIEAEDVGQGFLLLEDLGDATFTRKLAEASREDEETLYAGAVDVLATLHGLPPDRAVPRGLAAYDDAKLGTEADLLPEWYGAAVLANPLSSEARSAYRDAWRPAFAALAAEPKTLVLRDYHVDNLMWLPERRGVAKVGLLDFQDAVAGPGAYDLMSLLEDARRDIAPDLVSRMRARYRAAVPASSRDSFKASYAILAAQRHAKVIGIFTRLCRRDRKPDYLVHIPRVWRLLERAVRHPLLHPVGAWLDRYLPPETRRISTAEARP